MQSSHQVILVLMGICGSGKSTVAELIAKQLGWDLQEGDDMHPSANVTKMASGKPLTDEDRLPWLQTIAQWIRQHNDSGCSGIVTCSALKRVYRDVLREGTEHVVFVHLTGTREQIQDRLTMRTNHFMPSSLLDTQIGILEPLNVDEGPMLEVDVSQPPRKLADIIIDSICLKPNKQHIG